MLSDKEIDSLNLTTKIESIRNTSTDIWNFYKEWVTTYQTIDYMDKLTQDKFYLDVRRLRSKYADNMFAQRLIDVFVLELEGV